jgi:hypothetical protein
VIVFTPAPGILKSMAFGPGAAAFESAIACASEPAPELFVFITVNVAPNAAAAQPSWAVNKNSRCFVREFIEKFSFKSC